MLFDLVECNQWGLDAFLVEYDEDLIYAFMIKHDLSVIMP